jgi:SAM-dependent methyltransferase
MSTPPQATPDAFDDPRAHWDARYAQPGWHYGESPNAFLLREAGRLAPGSRVLCVADGEGRNSLWLAEQGHAVTAFDLSPVAVDKARRWAQQRGLTADLHVAAWEDWPWSPEQFDAVVAIFIQFVGPGARERLFAQMWQTLRPGGLLLLHGYTTEQLKHGTGGPGRLENLYTLPLVRALLPQAQWLLLRAYEAELAEGRGHVGRSALLDGVARKVR